MSWPRNDDPDRHVDTIKIRLVLDVDSVVVVVTAATTSATPIDNQTQNEWRNSRLFLLAICYLLVAATPAAAPGVHLKWPCGWWLVGRVERWGKRRQPGTLWRETPSTAWLIRSSIAHLVLRSANSGGGERQALHWPTPRAALLQPTSRNCRQ